MRKLIFVVMFLSIVRVYAADYPDAAQRVKPCSVELSPNLPVSKFGINPATAVVGSVKQRVTELDFRIEIIALNKTRTFWMGPPDPDSPRIYGSFSLQEWNAYDGPISRLAKEALSQSALFRQDVTNNNLGPVEITLERFKAGQFAGNVREDCFHIDGSLRCKADDFLREYIFNLSTGENNFAPTEFYIGSSRNHQGAETLIEQALRDPKQHRSVRIPDEFEPISYQMGNGTLVILSGHTLHRRTPATRGGWRYFLRIGVHH